MALFELPKVLLVFFKVFLVVTCISFWVYIFIQRKK